MSRDRIKFLVEVSLLPIALLACAAPAAAQDSTGASGASTTPNPSDDRSGLREIIVTASRRASSLQKESREITAISADDLQKNGVTSATSLQTLAPGLTIATNGPQLQISIRGVGDRTIDAHTDPAVAINVDGIYYPKSYEASGAFFDLDRVEVLKGPQGTLYGRNASAGAINLIATKPKFEDSGFAEVSVGNYDSLRAAAAINLKLNDIMALRVSGQAVSRNGFLTDGYNDDKSQAMRAILLIEQGDTSLQLTGSYSHLDGLGQAGVIAQTVPSGTVTSVPNPSNPWAGPTDPATLARLNATNPQDVQPARDGFQNVNTYAFNIDFEHNFGWGRLTLLPSYVGSDFSTKNYAALGVPIWEYTKSDQFSGEARLSSPDHARVKWVAGLFAAQENVKDDQQAEILTTLVFPTVAPKRDDSTWAAFGELNAGITDRLRLVAGLRYTWERKNQVGVTAPYFGTVTSFPVESLTSLQVVSTLPGAQVISGTRTDKALNYRAGIEYDIAPAVMAYANIATGFKAGGFYGDIAPNNTFKPEHLIAYTLGIRSRMLSNRLQVNVETFYWDYRDKQESFLGNGFLPGSVVLLTQNAASARLYGFDASVIAKVTQLTRLSGELEYNNTKYGTFIENTATGVVDNSGQQLVRAPAWSGHVSLDQNIPVNVPGKLDLNAQMRFSAGYWLTNDFIPLEWQKPYQIYDASLTWTSDNDRLTVSGFVKNIGNRAYYTGGTYSVSSLVGAMVGIISDPRTYGVRLRVKF